MLKDVADLIEPLSVLMTRSQTNQLNTKKAIDEWVNILTSRIVMRYDKIGVDEIIYDYFELG